MLTELYKTLTLIDSFKKGGSLWLRLKWGNVLFYTLDHLLNSLLFMQLESISGCENYLYFIYLLKNEIYYFSNITG